MKIFRFKKKILLGLILMKEKINENIKEEKINDSEKVQEEIRVIF
jgi:hypothetical protein